MQPYSFVPQIQLLLIISEQGYTMLDTALSFFQVHFYPLESYDFDSCSHTRFRPPFQSCCFPFLSIPSVDHIPPFLFPHSSYDRLVLPNLVLEKRWRETKEKQARKYKQQKIDKFTVYRCLNLTISAITADRLIPFQNAKSNINTLHPRLGHITKVTRLHSFLSSFQSQWWKSSKSNLIKHFVSFNVQHQLSHSLVKT